VSSYRDDSTIPERERGLAGPRDRTVLMVPTCEAVVAAEKEVDEIGRRVDGFGDGFGSFGDIRND